MGTAPDRPAHGPIIGSASRELMPRHRGLITAALVALVVIGVATAGAIVGMGADRQATALLAPRFVEEAAAAGLHHRYDGEFTFVVGGGVAVLDCNDDGRPDLYLAGGSEPARLFRNVSEVGGVLSFEHVASGSTELDAVTGAYPLDVDGDGTSDLAVLRVGEDVLLRGTGDCGFERANEAWGFDGGDDWSTAFSATWEEGSGLPTLAIGHYLEPEDPDRSTCADNVLVRPEGDRYGAAVTLSPGWCTLSMLFSDWDRSGRRDLRVSNDRHYAPDAEEQLWRIKPGEAPRAYGADDGWQTVRLFGMGIASRDVTGDGYPEVYLTSQGDNKLQTLAEPGPGSEPRYVDIALRRGVTAHRPYDGDTTLPSTAWHPEFADVNNDGFTDLLVTKGNVEAQADHAMLDPTNLMLGQPDGTFLEGAADAGIVSFARSRGAAVVDLNLDGLLDLVVVHRRENVSAWRNLGAGEIETGAEPMGHWLAVRPRQPGANRDAVGAWIEVRTGDRVWRVERTVGGGHASGQLGWVHVGLGEAERAEVRVTWPDGSVGPWHAAEADVWAVIDRGAGAPLRWTPETESDR